MKKSIAVILSMALLMSFMSIFPVSAVSKDIRLVYNPAGGEGSWYVLPKGVKAEVGDTLIFPETQDTVFTEDDSIYGLAVNLCLDKKDRWGNWGQPWNSEEGEPMGEGFPVTVVEGENIIYCSTVYDSGKSIDLPEDKMITVVRFNSGDIGVDLPNKPAHKKPESSSENNTAEVHEQPINPDGKEIRLVWNDEGADGKWYKLPSGVTPEVGDAIIFPDTQDMVTTPDGKLEGLPVNVSNKNDWTKWETGNWGQPWSNGGKGFPIAVVEGENAIYCMTIFGDGVNNVDGKYGPTDIDGDDIICLIRFNSGEKAPDDSDGYGDGDDDDLEPIFDMSAGEEADTSAESEKIPVIPIVICVVCGLVIIASWTGIVIMLVKKKKKS